MTTVQRSETEIDEAAELAALAQRPAPSETEVEAQALQDGDAWSDEEREGAEAVWPSPSPVELRVLRHTMRT